MRRPLFAIAVLFLLSACIGVNVNDTGKDDDGQRPTARSEVDGVEVWDLTGPPSTEAFGIREDRNVGIYETREPRSIRFEFPGGSDLAVEATLVTFEHFDAGDTPEFSIGVRTAQLKPNELVTTFRDVLDQFDVSTEPADRFEAELRVAPDDQSERINVGSDSVTLGELQISAQVGIAPIAGAGRVIIGGFWRQD